MHVKCNNPECNNMIEATLNQIKTNKKLFCSDNCRYRVHYLKIPKVKKICELCGNSFDTYDEQRTHCSVECENRINVDGNYEFYTRHKHFLDLNYFSDTANFPKCKSMISFDEVEKLYQEKKSLQEEYIDMGQYAGSIISYLYGKKVEEIKRKKKALKRQPEEADIYDPAYLFVKCNNPNCNEWFPINLYNLNKAVNLFCNKSCKNAFHKIQTRRIKLGQPKLPKLVKHCKRCHRKFRTYDDSREFCCHYCELYKDKRLSPYQYRRFVDEDIYVIHQLYKDRHVSDISFDEFIDVAYKHYELTKLDRKRKIDLLKEKIQLN